MATETENYTTILASPRGYLAVLMVWHAHQDSYYPRVLAGPLKRVQAASIAYEEAQHLGVRYRAGS